MIERDIIGIFGKMNAGKSSLMNLLTQQETSIVDSAPGTTADSKIAMIELHGLGPVKLIDTAGFDEPSVLGDKKRYKIQAALKECDLALLVIDPSTKDFENELKLVKQAHELDKQLMLVFNLFADQDRVRIDQIQLFLNAMGPCSATILHAINLQARQPFIASIIQNYIPRNLSVDLLPFVESGEFYILNIPMDQETPLERYLKPQAMAEAYITRKWAYPVSYRMDLQKARGGDRFERARWDFFMANFTKKPKAIITDSQAIDILSEWVPDDILVTTFSVMMINYTSLARLHDFVNGIEALKTITSGEEVLIAEACNHSRINEDIGTVQIPNLIKKMYPGVVVKHVFGREMFDNIDFARVKLVIHCGGCMISNQRMAARLRDLKRLGIPITNYGIFLALMQGEEVLHRVVAPWVDSNSQIRSKGFEI
jgi:[FeFe] hydrogenase H-cluster maturation GTPase HydF